MRNLKYLQKTEKKEKIKMKIKLITLEEMYMIHDKYGIEFVVEDGEVKDVLVS